MKEEETNGAFAGEGVVKGKDDGSWRCPRHSESYQMVERPHAGKMGGKRKGTIHVLKRFLMMMVVVVVVILCLPRQKLMMDVSMRERDRERDRD